MCASSEKSIEAQNILTFNYTKRGIDKQQLEFQLAKEKKLSKKNYSHCNSNWNCATTTTTTTSSKDPVLIYPTKIECKSSDRKFQTTSEKYIIFSYFILWQNNVSIRRCKSKWKTSVSYQFFPSLFFFSMWTNKLMKKNKILYSNSNVNRIIF